MKIAVLMSTFNGEKYLVEQIESIINQDCFNNIDLIVRDDCSSDKTLDILNHYQEKGVLKYCSGKNVGGAKSFLKLLVENPGYDYYAFADQDDVWFENKISTGIKSIESLKGPSLYCSNCILVNHELSPFGRCSHRKEPTYNLVSILCLASCAQGCTSILNANLAKIFQNNVIPETFIMHDSLITCLSGLIGANIVYNHTPSMFYRIHDENVSGIVSLQQEGVTRVLFDRLHEITRPKKISTYSQLSNIIKVYMQYIPHQNLDLCNLVIKSEKSIQCRLILFFDKDLRCDTLNKTFTKKMEILFGND